MRDYAMLVLPAANRVYAEASVRLAQAELEIFDSALLGGRLSDIGEQTIGGVPYLTFRAEELAPADLDALANLSVRFAVFQREGDLLRPLETHSLDHFDDDLITIQKYVGKTNEYFTKLLLNVTLMASSFAGELSSRPLSVLDPVCGRGTTLNQALMYGCHTAGVDMDRKDFDAYAAFIRTWLKRKRLKHTASVTQVRRDRTVQARRLDVTLGLDKESYKAGDTRQLSFVNVDTTRAAEFLPANSFDVLVADLPYGVQHGSTTARRPGLRRTPTELLVDALPGWLGLLKPGAAVGLAWNTHVARRADLADVLAERGLDVLDSGPYANFRHRVDQAIIRDVLVARIKR